MQVRRGTGNDMGLRQMGGDLTNPAINLALGQNYIEHLRDSPATAGLLPRVIAAYNAGPTPVARWASEVRDNGDPLLFIESIPYWETRAYVGTVLRNLWVYERQLGTPTNSLTTLAQGQWPRVPTVSGDNRRRLTQNEGQRAR
jgi:soluble lytic murein transglycosylase-like protein